MKDGKVENLNHLLKRGANIEVGTFGKNATALHMAALGNKGETARVLIAAGIKVDARDVDKVTPLMVAATAGAREVAEFLIQSGADVNAKGTNGATALKLAIATKQPALGVLLQAHGAKE